MRRQFLDLIRRFHRDERGVFMVIFGVMAVVAIALSGAVVDYVSLEQARTRAQVALDSAALALQPRIYDDDITEEAIRAQAEGLVRERVGSSTEPGGNPDLALAVVEADINLDAGTLLLRSQMAVQTIFVRLVGVNQLNAEVISEATRGSSDVEVSVALDVTGSMDEHMEVPCDPDVDDDDCDAEDDIEQTKIEALRRALAKLIDAVVQDTQPPTAPSYSKMALVPYSTGVNVGGYATDVRGPIAAARGITGATWAVGTAKTITAAVKSTSPNRLTITAANHGFLAGNWVYIKSVSGLNNGSGVSQVNNRIFMVAPSPTTNTFQLQTTGGTYVNPSSYTNYSSGGTVRRCLVVTCEIVVTSNAHGFANNDHIVITGVGGLTQINNATNTTWQVTGVTTNTFVLSGLSPALPAAPGNLSGTTYGTYTSGGNAYCTKQTAALGCEYYRFTNDDGNIRVYRVNTCAVERTGADAYTDDPPSDTFLGRNYRSGGAACLGDTIVPLSDDIDMLKGIAEDLTQGGSTAGHIGLAWAWYMLSPEFAYLWPTDSQPAPESEDNVIRAVVLMTDGLFNTAYCNGVVAQDSGSGSGGSDTHINCDAQNGIAKDQGEDICQGMKDADEDIVIYTVAFALDDIVDDDDRADAEELMLNCASEASKFYRAENSAALNAAFEAIGQDLASLRVTR